MFSIRETPIGNAQPVYGELSVRRRFRDPTLQLAIKLFMITDGVMSIG